ncbi:hypothetical protein GCM10025876_25240 [Demequina litorisediminis]|uniref:Uncharacterized protein n=1 Tax=Demequina litorisediminis TaxID=1849022 RepID=A0ABQ6IET5_9MICO|nr:hypothetical protein GCM10025876_25240 [Demequina litorisediminis]
MLRAVSTLTADSLDTRPRVFQHRRAVPYVPISVVMTGSDDPRPSMRRAIDGSGENPPLRMMPVSDGKPSAA